MIDIRCATRAVDPDPLMLPPGSVVTGASSAEARLDRTLERRQIAREAARCSGLSSRRGGEREVRCPGDGLGVGLGSRTSRTSSSDVTERKAASGPEGDGGERQVRAVDVAVRGGVIVATRSDAYSAGVPSQSPTATVPATTCTPDRRGAVGW